MKILRYIMSVPAIFLTIFLSYSIAGEIMFWIFNFKGYKLLLLLLFFIGTIYNLYAMATVFCIGIVSKISPSNKFTYWVVLLSTFYILINNLLISWSNDIEYKGRILTIAVIYTIICLYLTITIVYSSRILKDEFLI